MAGKFRKTIDEEERAQAKSLSCGSCGAPLELRYPTVTERIGCAYCGAILDAKSPSLEVLQKLEKAVRFRPVIPLGTRGMIRGEKMECIGMQRRRVTVEGLPYEWSEYLLFNPYKGFRYLGEFNGHWHYIKRLRNTPVTHLGSDGREEAEFLNKSYKHFQTARAVTTFVVGEFNWQVEIGETATCSDFIHPPYILSREHSASELAWSIGEYISPESIWKAFKLPGDPREACGVAPTQIWQHEPKYHARRKLWLTFCAATLALQLFFGILVSGEKLVHEQRFQAQATDPEKSRVTEPFELEGRTSNVEVSLETDLSNNWCFFSMALINDETGTAMDFGREVSYYFGSDWSEGGNSDTAYLPSVPAGRYYLRIEPEMEKYPVAYMVRIRRDVPLWRFLFLSMVLLSVPPLFLMWRRRSFEYQRWLESDHPMEPLVNFEGGDE